MSTAISGWVFISCTKTVRRYHLPEIDHVVSALREAENDYEFNLKCVWNEFVAHCAIELLPQIDIVVNYLADIDCLQSLSRLGLLPGYIMIRFAYVMLAIH